jgi:uncharacterized protein (DUF362 family)
MARPTVILRACPTYDTARIRGIVTDALDTLGLRPRGRTLVKPNCVASGKMFPHAYTRPEFLEGVFLALRDRAAPDLEELAIGERSGITMPTRYAFKGAGYYPMLERAGVDRIYHFDEVSQVEIGLHHPERLRDLLFTPEPVAKADFFVNCPKFKAHPWTTVTFSMKNYIGIQDDRHRLIDHDHKLDEKVADLQYVVQPQLIAIDAITAGEGRMLTPLPFDLGLVVLGDNQVAFDAVCCHIIGVDPLSVKHIRLAHERGFGPVDLAAIDVIGDVSLADAQRKAEGFRTGLIRVEEYFEGTSIRAYGGPPPGGEVDYCWGGCPGALEEAIEIVRLFDAAADDKLPRVHIVFGRHEGPLDVQPGEKVIFMGDCAEFHGQIAGKQVDLPSIYEDRSHKDPRTEPAPPDIMLKLLTVKGELRALERDGVMRIAGCPVSVAEQILALVEVGGLKNPYLEPSEVLPFTNAYFSWRVHKALRRLRGAPYNKLGPVERGEAQPPQSLPPDSPLR